jgi:hypothetical protein
MTALPSKEFAIIETAECPWDVPQQQRVLLVAKKNGATTAARQRIAISSQFLPVRILLSLSPKLFGDFS